MPGGATPSPLDRYGSPAGNRPSRGLCCGRCNRLGLTAEGRLCGCLFSSAEWELRELLRAGGEAEQIVARVEECLAAKRPDDGIQTAEFIRPQRAMYQIGG